MCTNPFYDAWRFLIGRTEPCEPWNWTRLTLLFLVLLVASARIARKNWQQDAAHQTGRHLAIWFMRLMIGAMWYRSLSKLPLPVSGGFQGWTPALGENAALEFQRWIVKNVFPPLLPVIKAHRSDRAFQGRRLHARPAGSAAVGGRHAVRRAPDPRISSPQEKSGPRRSPEPDQVVGLQLDGS